MARNIRTTFLYVSASIVFLASLYHLLFRDASISVDPLRRSTFAAQPYILPPYDDRNRIIHEQQTDTGQNPCDNESKFIHEDESISIITTAPPYQVKNEENSSTNLFDRNTLSKFNNSSIDINVSNITATTAVATSRRIPDNSSLRTTTLMIPSVAILFPAWEALVVVSNADEKDYANYFCLFDTKETSLARFSGMLPYPDRKTFTCELPTRVRRRIPFRQPVLTRSPEEDKKNDQLPSTPPELLRWNFIVYDLVDTGTDVVFFVKGINNRQGFNRSPTEFKCVFGDDINGVKTTVTSSMQEVFRCQKPELTAFTHLLEENRPIKASLEISQFNQLVPSIAYYTPQRKIATGNGKKSLLCASTMVYNVAKFLREWVTYHAKIGVEKFILYDNGSDDDLGKVVNELNSEGYDIETLFWLWPKTQEAGFSHAALHANGSCHWMMYIDVDEFLYSPLWAGSKISRPSKSLLRSFLPQNHSSDQTVGQIMIACYEFGPSNQKEHPLMGVTQGYNCRKMAENRHKSIVLLNAVNETLLNVIHHFELKNGYEMKKVSIEDAVVNHYKYQAWPEFKAKFRRRVSAYVVDWTQTVNLKSNDRTPGLGYQAIEPQGWAEKFCEVYDNGLKDLTRRWFGKEDSGAGIRMAWQR